MVDHPGEVHAVKTGEEGDGKEDHRYHGQPRDLLALLLGNARSIVARDVGQPSAAFVQPVPKVFYLVRVVVQLCSTTLVHARDDLDADHRRSDTTAVPLETQPEGLSLPAPGHELCVIERARVLAQPSLEAAQFRVQLSDRQVESAEQQTARGGLWPGSDSRREGRCELRIVRVHPPTRRYHPSRASQ